MNQVILKARWAYDGPPDGPADGRTTSTRRMTLLFPTRYHMMVFQTIFKISNFFGDPTAGPPGRRAENFVWSKSPQQYFRKSQEVWLPVYRPFRSC